MLELFIHNLLLLLILIISITCVSKSLTNTIVMTKDEILNHFKHGFLDSDSKAYLRYHSLRYQYLLEEMDKIISKFQKKEEKISILDIGPAYQTELLRSKLPRISVDSLGFYDQRFPLRKIDRHYQYDLNKAQYKKEWIKTRNYNIVIMAELIEHLYTAPKLVLGFIQTTMLKGGILIIQTPNAVSLDRRIKMLLGKHPYDTIREDNLNPGHFREHTLDELLSISKDVGFKVKSFTIDNYFVHKRLIGIMYDLVCKILPKSFRHGITLILEKQ